MPICVWMIMAARHFYMNKKLLERSPVSLGPLNMSMHVSVSVFAHVVHGSLDFIIAYP